MSKQTPMKQRISILQDNFSAEKVRNQPLVQLKVTAIDERQINPYKFKDSDLSNIFHHQRIGIKNLPHIKSKSKQVKVKR